MDAVAFDTVIHDGKIDVPQQYLPYYPSFVRVILIKEQDALTNDLSDKERLAAFQRLDGCLKGCNLSIDEARAERLSRQ
jgi:hypothetical protein